MANKIKGITLEIGGDVQPLEKALVSVNKKTKDLETELKSVERLLKLDPKNTELLAQKQTLLTKQVENSREKLLALKKAQDQVNEAFRKGEIGEEQYRHFSRQVINAEQDLNKFESNLRNMGRTAEKAEKQIKDLGKSVKDMGDKVSETGKNMTEKITVPVTVAGGLLLKGAIDAETAQNKLQASLGATDEEAEELAESARNVWKQGFGESLPAVNDALIMAKHNMLLAGKPLEDFTASAIAIGEIFDQDVNEVIAAARVMAINFGIDGREALDIITGGFQGGADYSNELLETLREYSPQFVKIGVSADEMMSMLIEGVNAGAWNLDKVGDAIKEYSIRAQDGSKTTAEGFAMIGLDAAKMGKDVAKGGDSAKNAYLATIAALAKMQDKQQQEIAGVALFGTQWEDVKAQVILAMDEGIKKVRNFDGATAQATADFKKDNPMLALSKAGRELQDAFGPALLPLAEAITSVVVPAIKALAAMFAALPKPVQQIIVAAIALVAALGPIVFIAGKVIGTFGLLIEKFSWVARVAAPMINIVSKIGPLLAGLASGPVGWAVIAITGLIAIFATLYKTSDRFKAWVDGLVIKLKDGFSDMVSWATVKLNQLIDLINNIPGVEVGYVYDAKTMGIGGEKKRSHFATGTSYAPGGLAWVGERGPELIDLPRGSKVYTNQQSMAMMSRSQTLTVQGEVFVRGVNDMNQLIGATRILADEIIRGNRCIPQAPCRLPFKP